MRLEQYKSNANKAKTTFTFISKGPKGNIVKIVLYSKMKAYIYFEGSNDARIRLYQMAISKNFDELSEIFEIKGIFKRQLLPFDKNINFSSFLIRRKTS